MIARAAEAPPGNDQRRPRQESGVEKVIAATGSDSTASTDKLAGFTAEPLSGIDRAIANISAWDAANFRAAVEDRAMRPGCFTIESVLDDTGVHPDDHPNRIGALTRALAVKGVIVRVGYTQARRASRAGAAVALWRGRHPEDDRGPVR